MEKQKLRYNYGVTEHQLINYVKKARYVAISSSQLLGPAILELGWSSTALFFALCHFADIGSRFATLLVASQAC